MRITIPEEYRGHFQKETMWLKLKDADNCATKEYAKVFVTRWRNNALLLLNEAECERLVKNMESAPQAGEDTHGFERLIKASIRTAVMTNGEIEIPEHLASWLEGSERTIIKDEIGILLR